MSSLPDFVLLVVRSISRGTRKRKGEIGKTEAGILQGGMSAIVIARESGRSSRHRRPSFITNVAVDWITRFRG